MISSEPSISYSVKESNTQEDTTNKIKETFSDDSNIGRPKLNKIQIDIIEKSGFSSANRPNKIASIKFYSITDLNEWNLKQTLELESYALMNSQPLIEDFNNDGLKDITFISNSVARGANEVRTLLIYDKAKDELIHIKNSENYPNLVYNKKLKCIDSWMFHGATTTVFLKLDGDMLKEFAFVDTGLERVVTVIDKDGNTRVLNREKMDEEDIFTRYRDFDPPEPYR